MWVVIFGRHWVYMKHKEYRYESPYWICAVAVHQWWAFRYSLTVMPVKYLKMYKSGDVVDIRTYSVQKAGGLWED